MKKNLLLLFSSILFVIFLLEVFLVFFGKYQNLTKNNLSPSKAIYERAHSSKHNYKHPDLNYIIQNYYDFDGVKNFDNKITSKKKNIIAFFGDSFTENVGVDKNFEYSNILNQKLENYNIVNYGVGGYSADQVFIRFLKYKHHDIKYIFYLLMPGDERFSTKSEFNKDGNFIIDEPELDLFFQLIGKLNLTYFLIDSYYSFKSLAKDSHSLNKIENYQSILSNKIYQKFYQNRLHECKNIDFQKKKNNKTFKKCMSNLVNLLKIFRSEAESNNIEFILLIYPDTNFVSLLDEILNLTENKIKYFVLDMDLAHNKRLVFKNPKDPHWNEYGNVFYAKNLLNIFSQIGLTGKKLNINETFDRIDLFYSNLD